MSICWVCGQRFSSEQGRFTMCAESWDECGRFGDDEFARMSRALFSLVNTKWITEDEELFATSDIADRMARIYLRHASWETVNKLLIKKKDERL